MKPTLFALAATALIAAAPPTAGQPAPAFDVKDLQGKPISLAALKGKVVVLEWTNPGCPFVVRHYETGILPALQKQAAAQGAVWITVNSTNAGHKDFLADAALGGKLAAWKNGAAHVVADPAGTLGQSYGAKTTPHVFVIDGKGVVAYAGAVDDDPRGNKPERVGYLAQALEALKAGKAPATTSTAPYGCSVKYAQ